MPLYDYPIDQDLCAQRAAGIGYGLKAWRAGRIDRLLDKMAA